MLRAAQGRLIGITGINAWAGKAERLMSFSNEGLADRDVFSDQYSRAGGGGSQISLFRSNKGLSVRDQLVRLVVRASDKKLPISERIEAYEELIDAELGDTLLVRAKGIERDVNLRQIYLKFEGSNPTGTHKDRIAFAQVKDALMRGYDAMTLATCGNYGAAVARACGLAGVKCHIYLPSTYHPRRLDEMTKCGADLHRAEGDYENAVKISSEYASREGMYDANPGGENTTLQLRVYGEIADEIVEELGDAPEVVAVPVSNGTTLAGIYRGFLKLYRKGKTSHIPKMVAGSSFRKNPIVRSFSLNAANCQDLDPEEIRETHVNEPLINWHSTDGDLALEAIRNTDGWTGDLSDRSLMQYSRTLKEKESLSVLPAASAGLAALLQRHHESNLGGGRYVAVVTGKR